MKERTVKISDHAEADLVSLYHFSARRSGDARAFAFIERIYTHLESYRFSAARGSLRDDVRPGLRVVGFEKRVSIAFVVENGEVIILHIFYGGQNWMDEFASD